MTWTEKLGGTRGSPIDLAATAAKRVALPVAATAARAARRAAGVRTFTVNGRELPYVVHPYNETWRNERSVELAVAFDWLKHRPAGPTLEIGHVLGHYQPVNHTIVDLYEPAAGVLNVDALAYAPNERFTSIVSVSTLEHVGFDEDDQNAEKTQLLVDHLAGLLAPGGELLMTFPLGYNRHLDDHIASGSLGFSDFTVMRRLSTLGAWEQAPVSDLHRARYGFPFRHGNMIGIGVRRDGPAPTS